jgi:hypothetical protein
MTVAELIAILQKQDPTAEVVLREPLDDTSFFKVREVRPLALRTYSRKGMVYFQGFGEEYEPVYGTDVGNERVPGVLLE